MDVVGFFFQLMYFSASCNANEGFLRALSVASGTHMPRLPRPDTRAMSRSDRYIYITRTVISI